MSNASPIISPALEAAAKLDSTATTATYTVGQVAGLLQCSQRHVWRMADLNAIPGKLRVGRLVRFNRAAVDAWIAAGCPKSGNR
jgi:excisionase family DNA binding protein